MILNSHRENYLLMCDIQTPMHLKLTSGNPFPHNFVFHFVIIRVYLFYNVCQTENIFHSLSYLTFLTIV